VKNYSRTSEDLALEEISRLRGYSNRTELATWEYDDQSGCRHPRGITCYTTRI